MKLGTQTNSLINHLYGRSVIGQPEPIVGMGCTLLGWTDRNAGTIIEVSKTANGKSVLLKVQEDRAVLISGDLMSEGQEYEYTPNPKARVYLFRQSGDGMWHEVVVNEDTGRLNKTSGKGLIIGERDSYRDPSF